MSDRFKGYKGSSRSSRDDYRKDRGHKEREERRSRSRSPRRPRSSPPAQRHARDELRSSRNMDKIEDERRHSPDSWEGSDEEVPAPPPPPRISKVSMGFSKPKAPIKMTLGASSKSAVHKPTVASVFSRDDDDDDEPEEMPAEAKMRMRNIGRETPTSAGPNSFGKTKQGFCDAKKVFEKNLKQALETAEKPANKFPQTIYKIKGP
ncbi:PEST proteolytic signal-containing nuclear protein [Bicyclus anynana]|uniref:PEST proteolytic signal-containing nuclear protein n=1 Tax=Bicyclus anynana TaxID=110368 RepID=A0A6J1MYE5_BICAN|nr:PEST proteolytic signal-containing nuclear protein [Bicyclus anynana]